MVIILERRHPIDVETEPGWFEDLDKLRRKITNLRKTLR